MSFADAPPQKTALQNDTFRSVGLPILFLGGFAVAIWSLGQYLWRTAEEGTQTVRVVKSPSTSGGEKDHVVLPAPSPFDPMSADNLKSMEEDEGSSAISIMPSNVPTKKLVGEWKMRGVIYDLITLKPVPGTQVIFTDNVTNSRAQIQADAHGRYRAILPALAGRGYLMTLSKPGYWKSYLNRGAEGVAVLTLARRKEIVKELSSLIEKPVSLQPNSDMPLVTDFHMAPK